MSVSIDRNGRGYTLQTHLTLPERRETVFPFFADAANLQVITPEFLRFHILTPLPIAMYTGTVIDYRLRIGVLPVRWRTRIAAWDPPYRFVDEMVRGPYRWWRHEHVFEPTPTGGTTMVDRVEYGVPGGALVHRLFVKRRVRAIFEHRANVLREMFGPSGRLSGNGAASVAGTW